MRYSIAMLNHDERPLMRARISAFSYLWPLFLLVALLMPGRILRLATCDLLLTDKRVIGRLGTLHRRHIAWRHSDILHVGVEQSPLGLLFDYGVVTLSHKDGARIRFAGVTTPMLFQREVEEQAELATLGRSLRGWEKDVESF